MSIDFFFKNNYPISKVGKRNVDNFIMHRYYSNIRIQVTFWCDVVSENINCLLNKRFRADYIVINIFRRR